MAGMAEYKDRDGAIVEVAEDNYMDGTPSVFIETSRCGASLELPAARAAAAEILRIADELDPPNASTMPADEILEAAEAAANGAQLGSLENPYCTLDDGTKVCRLDLLPVGTVWTDTLGSIHQDAVDFYDINDPCAVFVLLPAPEPEPTVQVPVSDLEFVLQEIRRAGVFGLGFAENTLSQILDEAT